MIWTREQAKALIDRALSLSKAEETFVGPDRRRPRQPRFARNTATTSGGASGYSLAITASFGKKSGTVTTADSTTPACGRHGERGRDRPPVAGQPGSDAGARPAGPTARARPTSRTSPT